MPSRFIVIDRDTFCKALESKGFIVDEESTLKCHELIYRFQHLLDKTMFVKICTSLPAKRGDTRKNGTDSIKVMLIFDNGKKSGCLYKTSRVFRTGSQEAVIERTLERAREAYKVGTQRINGYLEKNV